MTTCRLCRRDCAPSSDLCGYHLDARRNLEAAFRQWDEAYGGLAWKDYLRRVSQSAETGLWAKEVADLLSKEASE